MLHLPISKSWITSRLAQRIYLICALANLSLLGSIIAILSALMAAGLTPWSKTPSETVLAIKVLLWPGIMGAAVIWVAMWYFWFTFDTSGWIKKAMWCCFFLLLAPFAHSLYYFFVYRRSSLVKESHTPQT
jgi:hypothetical protein